MKSKTQDSGKKLIPVWKKFRFGLYANLRMRIFILLGISEIQVVCCFENENLHSVGNIRRLGVCQSAGEAEMRIFIQVLGQKIGCMPIYWVFKDENLHFVKGQLLSG